MAGALVLTDTGHGTATQWMQCHTESVQARLVNRIHAGDRIFAAGTNSPRTHLFPQLQGDLNQYNLLEGN
jgi:hypothetical protein